MPGRRMFAVVSLVVALAVAACSNSSESPPSSGTVLPSRVDVSPSTPTTATPPPTISPSPQPQNRKAETQVKSTSGTSLNVTLDFTTTCGYPVWAPRSENMSVTWCDSQGDSLLIGGKPVKGTTKTSQTFAITLGVSDPQLSFTSGNGTCHVTITKMAVHAVDGRFTCVGVKDVTGKTTVNLTGTFSGRF